MVDVRNCGLEPQGDPATERPFGTREEFQQELLALVRDYAPRRFAICEEYGDRVDGWVEAWGFAFPERYFAYHEGSGTISIGDNAEQMLRRFRGRRVQLVWLDADPLPGAQTGTQS